MRITDDSGRVLDADYTAEADGQYLALIVESRSGRSGSRPARNPDYNAALTLLLARLGRLDAELVDALVDSRLTRQLAVPEADRRAVAGPVRLADIEDMEVFRRKLGTAQSRIAQARGATRGGKVTKRLRLRVQVPGYQAADAARLGELLATRARIPPVVFVMIWNPAEYAASADDGWYSRAIQATSQGQIWAFDWAAGSRRSGISPGDQAVLWRAHADRGLVASGTITSPVQMRPHWDGSGRLTGYVDIDWDTFLDVPDRLPLQTLLAEVPEMSWPHLQGGGIEVSPPSAAARLRQLWARHTDTVAYRSPDEPRSADRSSFPEGALTRIEVNRYERDARARQACLDHYGYQCAACGLSFEDRYGPLGRGYIHVHHTIELSRVPPGYQVNPITDLRPVCPNCHAMIHRGPGPALTIDELRQLLTRR